MWYVPCHQQQLGLALMKIGQLSSNWNNRWFGPVILRRSVKASIWKIGQNLVELNTKTVI